MSEKVLTDFEIVQILNTDRPKTGWAYGLCREVEAKVVSRCRAQGGNTRDNITQAAANKAAEEGALPFAELSINQKRALSEGLSALEVMADIWSAEIRLSEMAQRIADAPAEQRPGTISAMIEQAFIEGAYRHFLDHKDAADRASRQVANKAEVEPVCVAGRSGHSDFTVAYFKATDVPFGTKLYATPPATTGASPWHDALLAECMKVESCYHADDPTRTIKELIDWYVQEASGVAEGVKVMADNYMKLTCGVGASTVLTDERIDATMIKYSTMIAPGVYSLCNFGCDDDMRSFAREVAAQAGQVAVPGWISVDDRLPELQKEVLICCGYLVLGYRTDDKHDPENHNGWVIDFDNGMASPITHWMPLPPSPAKESK